MRSVFFFFSSSVVVDLPMGMKRGGEVKILTVTIGRCIPDAFLKHPSNAFNEKCL